MSLKPQTIPEIPPETVRVVHAAFPKGNIYPRDAQRDPNKQAEKGEQEALRTGNKGMREGNPYIDR